MVYYIQLMRGAQCGAHYIPTTYERGLFAMRMDMYTSLSVLSSVSLRRVFALASDLLQARNADPVTDNSETIRLLRASARIIGERDWSPKSMLPEVRVNRHHRARARKAGGNYPQGSIFWCFPYYLEY